MSWCLLISKSFVSIVFWSYSIVINQWIGTSLIRYVYLPWDYPLLRIYLTLCLLNLVGEAHFILLLACPIDVASVSLCISLLPLLRGRSFIQHLVFSLRDPGESLLIIKRPWLGVLITQIVVFSQNLHVRDIDCYSSCWCTLEIFILITMVRGFFVLVSELSGAV